LETTKKSAEVAILSLLPMGWNSGETEE